jgi:hypothetical protein
VSESRIIRVGNVVGECVCGNTPCDGLECGVFLPRQAPRKKHPPMSPEARARGWETRRKKYGQHGHNGSYAR